MQEINWLLQNDSKRDDVYNESNNLHEKKWDIESIRYFMNQGVNYVKNIVKYKGKIKLILYYIFFVYY